MISENRLFRIREQGYCNMTDEQIDGLAFGNRFAYILCSTILLVGVITTHIPTLSAMLAVAFFGVILPYHPFDYLYNHVVRHILKKPKLPKRSKQLKFACALATLFIAGIIYTFSYGMILAGNIIGYSLLAVAFAVSYLDLCIPSIVYNYMTKYEVK